MRYWGLAKPVVGEVFVTPAQSSALPFRSIVFKSPADLNSIIAAARSAIRAQDPTVVVSSSGTLSDRVEAASAPERFRAMLVGSLALLTVVLAGLALFAVSAQAVATRVREIGIRMALGATGRRVRAAVLRDAVILGASGTAIGLGLAWAGSQGLRALVPDAAGYDLVLVALVAALFLLVSVVAAAVPAGTASRIDPIVAMKRD
jgi:ABC-type antimicrobial peptide transport system permease subunit